MATAPSTDIPRSLKMLQVFWPIALAGLLGGAAVVQASAQVEEVQRRVNDLETNGTPVIRERLARMETAQAIQTQTLDRMEKKLDELDKRTRR